MSERSKVRYGIRFGNGEIESYKSRHRAEAIMAEYRKWVADPAQPDVLAEDYEPMVVVKVETAVTITELTKGGERG